MDKGTKESGDLEMNGLSISFLVFLQRDLSFHHLQKDDKRSVRAEGPWEAEARSAGAQWRREPCVALVSLHSLKMCPFFWVQGVITSLNTWCMKYEQEKNKKTKR